jgi:hypothetical protein
VWLGPTRGLLRIPVGSIISLVLQTILSLIGRITSSAAVHQASRAQMNCAVQCMNAQIYDWSTTLLESMKRQLTDCSQRTHRNFGFGTILCSFFFERVPCFSPRMTVYEDIWRRSLQYVDGQHYCRDRVAEGPWRPSMTTSLLGCHGRSPPSRTTHTRGLTSPEIHRYQCLLVRSEGR